MFDENLAQNANQCQENFVTLSLITSDNPPRLTKLFRLGADGTLQKEKAGFLVRGRYERIAVPGISGLRDVLTGLKPNQALTFGVANPVSSPIASGKAKKDGDITRSREYFDWPAGPGFMLLDYDPPDGGEPVAWNTFVDLLVSVCPAMDDAPMLVADSASSHIYNTKTNECLKGAGGMHVWVHVADARDIPRAGKVLFDRLWLAGQGYYRVSKSGQLLERTLVDAAVWQPERLDFAAGALCVPPLEQRRPAPVLVNTDNEPLNTAAALVGLTSSERDRLEEIKKRARAAVTDEQQLARRLWVDERTADFEERAAAELAGLDETERAQRIEQSRKMFVAAVQDYKLFGDFTLTHSSGKKVTVGEILDNPDKWHGERFADPLEPDYTNDRRIAWANLRSGGRPYVFSHAHGGQLYKLVRPRATIQAMPGEMPRLVHEADELMHQVGEVYQRGGELVRVADGGVLPVVGPWLRTHLESIAQWTKFDKKQKKVVVTDAPGELHVRILANRGGWTVPELAGVVRAPVLRPDGSMLDKPGYDAKTGVLLSADHPDGWPSVPDSPSRGQVRAAVRTLFEPFEYFPFADALSRSCTLAACLTAVQRPMLATAPAFAVNSYKAGSGKGKLAKAIAWLSGHEPSESPWSVEIDEQRKRILAKLMSGPAALMIDNVNGKFNSDTLCAVLTSTSYEDRRLGVSEMVTVPTQVLILVTGNNIQISGDLARRVMTITIDHGIEYPELLEFPFDPVARVRERWTYYRAAALTILRGFVAAGKPRHAPGCMGSFEEWDALIRQCVVWLQVEHLAPFELADPNESVTKNYQNDPDTARMRVFMDSFCVLFGEKPVKCNQLDERTRPGVGVFKSEDENDARENMRGVLDEIAGERGSINTRRLGVWLRNHANRVVNGMMIVSVGKHRRAEQWCVVRVGVRT